MYRQHYSSLWSSDIDGHWHKSLSEGVSDTKDYARHTFNEWKVLEEPTEEKEGKKNQSCTVCDFTRYEEISPLKHAHEFETTW